MQKMFPAIKVVFFSLSCTLWVFVVVALVEEHWPASDAFVMPALEDGSGVFAPDIVSETLDSELLGLEKAKESVLKHLSQIEDAEPGERVPVLCLVGPPGVGKTSLARAVAEATDREFVKIPLAEIGDETRILGTPGGQPGAIIRALKEANSANPVILLEGIDDLYSNAGDPVAALLDAIDGSQNEHFMDYALEDEVDLSGVLFIATASATYNIPSAIYQRLEIVEMRSYAFEEKMEIAKAKIIPKQLDANELKPDAFSISDLALGALIKGRTREAGVRDLNRLIGTLCQKAAATISDGARMAVSIGPDDLETYLGASQVSKPLILRKDTIGAVNALYWSAYGGGTMAIEAVVTPGYGEIVTTGNVGQILDESSMAARTVAKQLLRKYNRNARYLSDNDVHFHASGWGSDGPSAGVAMVTALISSISNIPVKKEVCMTGEINLHGDVLRIGGLQEKLIAAHNAGLRTAIIPADNLDDLEGMPEVVTKTMKIIPVKTVDEALGLALQSGVKRL